MNLKKTLLLVTSIAFLSNAATEEKCQALEKKLDSLEMRIDTIINSNRINPEAVTPSKKWGNGVFCSFKTGTNYIFNIELGYMHTINRKFLSREYLGKTRNYRLGVSAGVQFFNDEQILTDEGTIYNSSGYGPYLKLQGGSPVLLNFISFSGHIKGMYAMPCSDCAHGITDNKKVLGFGGDIEFWLTDKECITIGYTDEGEDPFDTGDKKDQIYPTRFRFTFGTKMFF